jgi:hypothetical protein
VVAAGVGARSLVILPDEHATLAWMENSYATS